MDGRHRHSMDMYHRQVEGAEAASGRGVNLRYGSQVARVLRVTRVARHGIDDGTGMDEAGWGWNGWAQHGRWDGQGRWPANEGGWASADGLWEVVQMKSGGLGTRVSRGM